MSTELAETKSTELSRAPEREYFLQPRFHSTGGEHEHELRVWMPGVAKNGVEVSLVEDHLEIVGRRLDTIPESWQPVFREIEPFDYRLRVRLNLQVDYERIAAHVEDGILTLTLPLKEEARPRTIEIN